MSFPDFPERFARLALAAVLFAIAFSAAVVDGMKEAEKPKYEITNVKAIPFGPAKRYRYEVHVKGSATIDELKEIGHEVVIVAKDRTPFNALSVRIFKRPDAMRANAHILFAPDGSWGRADKVATGKYSRMNYNYEHLKPIEKTPKEAGDDRTSDKADQK